MLRENIVVIGFNGIKILSILLFLQIGMNVPHHFAFRGCDDVTYIVSAYISAKMAKLAGNKFFILQNMLNTPRSTWGVQDSKIKSATKIDKRIRRFFF